MKLSWCLILLTAGVAFGQQNGGDGVPGANTAAGPRPFSGTPTGSCSGTQTAVDTTTGNYYSCSGAAWTKVGPGAGGAPSGSAGGALTGSYPNPSLSSSAVTSAVAGQTISPKQIGSTYLYADQFPGSTIDARINACNSALISAGGGTCDDTNLVAASGVSQTTVSTLNIGDTTNTSTNIRHILPTNATWTINITDGVSCGIKQWPGSVLESSSGPAGSGHMVFNLASTYNGGPGWCSDQSHGMTGYFRVSGFGLYNPSGGIINGNGYLFDAEDLVDHTEFHDLTMSNASGNTAYFNNIAYVSGHHLEIGGAGGIAVTVGSTTTGFVEGLWFYDSVFNNTGTTANGGAGAYNMLIQGAVWGSGCMNCNEEGDGATDTTHATNYIGSGVQGWTVLGGFAQQLCTGAGQACPGKYNFEDHSSGLRVIGTTQGNGGWINSTQYGPIAGNGNYFINPDYNSSNASATPSIFGAVTAKTTSSKVINGIAYSQLYTGASLDARVNACIADAETGANGATSHICSSEGEPASLLTSSNGILAQINVGDSSQDPVEWRLPASCQWDVYMTGGAGTAIAQYGNSKILSSGQQRGNCFVENESAANGLGYLYQTMSGNAYYELHGLSFFERNNTATLASNIAFRITGSDDNSRWTDFEVANYAPGTVGIVLGNPCCSGNLDNFSVYGDDTGGVSLKVNAPSGNGPHGVHLSNVSLGHPGTGTAIFSCTDGQTNPATQINITQLYEESNITDTTTPLNQISGCAVTIHGEAVSNVGTGTNSAAVWTIASNASPSSLHLDGLKTISGWGASIPAVVNNTYSGAAANVAYLDANGQLTEYNSNSSYFDSLGGNPTMTPQALGYTSVYAWGDSLTLGNQDGSGTTYPTALAALSGLTVNNEGIYGQTSLQIAVRMGAIASTVTVSGGTIPASGGVTVTFAAGYEPCYNATSAPGVLGVIDGIQGYLLDNGSHVYTFTRVSSGSAVSYTSGAWTPSVVPASTSLNIIWAGRNDTFSTGNATVANIKAMVNSLPGGASFLVLPIINLVGNSELNTGFSMGSNYAFIDGINQTLAALYPNNFIDVRRNLVNAYNPTLRGDQLDFSRDGTPQSYRAVYSGGTLSTTMTSSTCSFTIAGVPVSTMQNPNPIITFADNGEQVMVTSSSGSLQSTACIRGWAGTTAAAHSSGGALTLTDYLHLGANGYTLVANNAYTWMQAHASAASSTRITPFSTVFSLGANVAGKQQSTSPSAVFGRTEANTSYNHNVGLGGNALQQLYFAAVPGSNNTGMGDNSVSLVTTGSQITGLGTGACDLMTTETRATCLGYQAETAAGTSSAAEIGAGTNSVSNTLAFAGFSFITNTGAITGLTYATSTNCSSSASPAVCSAAAAGSVAVPVSGTTLVVDTTAVTANSQILLTFDSSLGTKLGVTCNTTVNQPTVSARTAGTSFTITMTASVTTNPDCISYSILN